MSDRQATNLPARRSSNLLARTPGRAHNGNLVLLKIWPAYKGMFADGQKGTADRCCGVSGMTLIPYDILGNLVWKLAHARAAEFLDDPPIGTLVPHQGVDHRE